MRGALPAWLWKEKPAPPDAEPGAVGGDRHLDLARESLRELLADRRVPPDVRRTLEAEYQELERVLDKLEHGHIHIAAFGRVSVGKSALLNALLGEERFTVSPLHGETKAAGHARWQEYDAGGVFLIDTPGINEVAGEERERLARAVAERADLVLFVADGDLTDTELRALRQISGDGRPLLLVLNKADRYTAAERALLLETLTRRAKGLVKAVDVVAAAARPAERTVIIVDEQGGETEERRRPPPDMAALKERLWDILKAEGKTLAAVNAGLFAGRVSDRLAAEILAVRQEIAERVVRSYCLGKGVAVALNPIPLADLLTVLADGAMIIHLGRVYGLPVTRTEAAGLLAVIVRQLALLMGTVWGMRLISAALKGVTLGLSTLVTASAQGAVAWYGTYVVGKAAERYFAHGKSWGEAGPKRAVQEILAGLDRDSLLAGARDDILTRLKSSR